jgi:hypothetical protein
MKKLLLNISIVAILVGCNNDLETEGISRVTYYPTFELEGGDLVVYEVGDPAYSEPGIEVTEGGQPIDFETEGESAVDTSTPGFYEVRYSAVNKDGYAGTAVRTIVVLEPNLPEIGDIEGGITSSNTSFSGQSLGQKGSITKLADHVYYVSDTYAHPSVDIGIRFLIQPDGTGISEIIPNSPFGLPLQTTIAFNVSAGDPVPLPGGGTMASPRDADIAFGIFLDDPDAPFYTVKTWNID